MVLNKSIKIPSTLEILRISWKKEEWQVKSPLQKWSFLYGIGRSCYKVFKLQVFEEDQTLHWFSYFPLIWFFIYIALVIYTAAYYIPHGEFTKCLPGTCICVGSIIASIPSMYVSLTKVRVIVHEFVISPGRYIYPDNDDDEDSEYYGICSKQIDASMKNFIFKMTILITSAVIGLIWPTYLFVSQGVKTTATQVKFPYLDENSNEEFICNFIFQSVVIGHGFIGYIGLEVGVDISADFVSVSRNLLEYRIRMLDQQPAKAPSDHSQKLFSNVIQQIRTYDKFTIVLRDLFYYRLFAAPLACTYSIAMAIFCQFTMGYAAGYGVAVFLWVQLFYVCEMGEHTDNNGFSDTLYHSNWYALPVKYQKDLMHMINGCQNGAKIEFGPFSIINRALFKEITNKIYSFVMFLLNFEG